MHGSTTSTIPKNLEGTGGAYLRVSKDDQEIATQRRTVADFEARFGVKVSPPFNYEDEGWSRDETERRPEWLRMLADVDAGKLQWLVVAAKDRFGTASGRRKVLFYTRLWDAGCKLILATTGEVLNAPSLASDLNALVDGDTEERELREKSNRALDKMRIHAAAARWLGGSIPYGLDVVCTDMTGTEFWRVQIDGPDMRVKISPNGSRLVYEGKHNFPGRDRGQFLTLRPSTDPTRIAVLLEVFEWFDVEALSTYQIAERLNARGVLHHRGEWAFSHVEVMLVNMAYLGVPVWNRTSRGKWNQFVGQQIVPHAEKNRRTKDHARADWVIAVRQFDPIVPEDRFERVQEKLATRSTDPRAPKSPELWLSGVLFCAHCGSKLWGTIKGDGIPRYVCGSYLRAMEGKGKRCPYRNVTHAEAEGWLHNYLDEIGDLFPAVANTPPTAIAARMQNAWVDAMERMAGAAQTMKDRVTEWARNADDAALAKVSRRPQMIALDAKRRPIVGTDGQFVEVEGEPRIVTKDAYRAIFATTREQDQARLDQLETEHTNLSLGWQTLPTERAKEKAANRLRELEEEIADLERRVTDAAAIHDQAMGELTTLTADWDAAREAVSNETGKRSKAQAVRKVVTRVNVTFTPTGLKRPKPAFYASEVEIVPAGCADGGGIVSNIAPVGLPPTASSGVTHGCECGTSRLPSVWPSGTGGSS